MESSRLKRLLELTRRVERARKGELLAAKAELSTAEALLVAAESTERTRLRELVEGGEASLSELELRAGLVVDARVAVLRSDAERQVCEEAVLLREDERLVATRDVRKMEILWERDRVEAKRATIVREQRFADDTRRPKGKRA
jgi:hypothetical protein